MKKFDMSNIEVFLGNLGDLELIDWLIINSIPPLVKFDPKYMFHVIGVSTASIILFAKN